ncbi:MAG: segregation and condensation protein A [Bacillota bacterium]|jgi:segregation and condensation protein A
MKYQIKLEVFEGPFDLLFHLIDKNEVDIYDIPISEITQQYLAYLEEMQSLDLEIASEFLVMAATLLAIKARMLLPKPPKVLEEENPEGEDPRDELVARLLEYKKYKLIAEFLQRQEKEQRKVFFRPNEEDFFISLFADQNPLEGVQIDDLKAALIQVLKKNFDLEPMKEIPREEITIKKKMTEITDILKKHPQGISFFRLFNNSVSKVEVVVQFLALLELMRKQEVKVSQSSLCGDIFIYAY